MRINHRGNYRHLLEEMLAGYRLAQLQARGPPDDSAAAQAPQPRAGPAAAPAPRRGAGSDQSGEQQA